MNIERTNEVGYASKRDAIAAVANIKERPADSGTQEQYPADDPLDDPEIGWQREED